MLYPVLRDMNNWLDNDFDDMLNTSWMPRMNVTAPAINVKENDKAYEVELAAPGTTKDDFKVNVDKDGCLTIKMEHKDEKKDENKKEHYLRREFSYSNYEQALTLPDDVEKCQAIASACWEWGCLVSKLTVSPTPNRQPIKG